MKYTIYSFAIVIFLWTFLFIGLSGCFYDIKEWNIVGKHLDEFVYTHTDEDRLCHTLTLYDNDDNIICEAYLNQRYKSCVIFDGHVLIIASNVNRIKSRRAYNRLINKVPENYKTDSRQLRKDKVVEKLKYKSNNE